MRFLIFSLASLGVLAGISTRGGLPLAAMCFALILFLLRTDIRDALVRRKPMSE